MPDELTSLDVLRIAFTAVAIVINLCHLISLLT